MHLDDAEDLAYRRLLDWYYMSERPLPFDIALVARRIRLDLDVVEPVIREFFKESTEGFRHIRCDSEIESYNIRAEQARQAGKLGGRRVSAGEDGKEPSRLAKQNRTEQSNKTIASKGFDLFWHTWPSSKRKVAKVECSKRWARYELEGIAEKIIGHVKLLKSSEQWIGGFEPAPLTYINQRRWEDDSQSNMPTRRSI
jgi:uncharacterized protein YdaU (DUF1376 family)